MPSAINNEIRSSTSREFLIIWVHDNIDTNDSETQQNFERLQNISSDVKLLNNSTDCVQLIKKVNPVKCFIIITGSFAQDLLPGIHSMKNVDSIYIFSKDKKIFKSTAQEWSKVKGIHTAMKSISDELRIILKPFTEDTPFMYILQTNNDNLTINTNSLDPTLIYSISLKETMLAMEYKKEQIEQMVKKFLVKYRVEPYEINILKTFTENYQPEKAIWWYTRNCFINKSLNQALHELDTETIVDMSFFIHDLHHRIKTLHQEQVSKDGNKTLTLYRSQSLPEENIIKIQNSKGGLLVFNSFLTAISDLLTAVDLAKRASSQPNNVGVLFTMKIDSTVNSTPFANIKKHGYYPNDDEILFSIQTIFQVESVKRMHGPEKVYEVSLILTNENNPQIKTVREAAAYQSPGSGWYRLACILTDMGKLEKAEEIHLNLLDKATDERDKGVYNYRIGSIKSQQGNHAEAVSYFERAINHTKISLPPGDPVFSSYYIALGNAYHGKGDYTKALENYELSLDILRKSLPKDHPTLGSSLLDVGQVYYTTANYSKALQYYEQSLEILKKKLPLGHPTVNLIYNNLGQTCQIMRDFQKALTYYEKFLEVSKKTLPKDDPALGTTYNNIGQVYQSLKDYPKALHYYNQSFEIFKKALPKNHPSLGVSYHNIAEVYQMMEQYSKSLSNYQKLFEILTETVAKDHPALAACHNNIGQVYHKMGDYSKALSHYQQALEILKETMPKNDPSLVTAYSNIAQAYNLKRSYPDALSNYKKLLKVLKKTVPSNHPSIAFAHNNIGQTYMALKNDKKALDNYEISVEILKMTFPDDHVDFGDLYYNMGVIKYNMRSYSEALSLFKKASSILKKSSSPNDPRLQNIRRTIETLKKTH